MTTSRETTTTFVERHIGNGAMGQVYELSGHKPLVIFDLFTAVTNIHPAVIKYMFCGNAVQFKIFKNECEALKKISHANVVRLYRYTEEGIKVGIVMEYCQKGSLKGVILDPTMTHSMNTVLTWGIQLFDALDHMYQKHKLVHRDIKPDNIFVTNEYQLKIGDFGLVKVVGDGTVTGTFAGTQRYMSPPEMKEDGVQRDVFERIKDADVSNSHRNDVYSLGLVMWEIIERRAIFTTYEISGGFDREQLLFDIALKRVTEIESPECQSEIQKIILRCTNFQRIHRPPASEVLDFLAQTQKANQFISSLPFMPTEDKSQKELMKPIGFDDRTEWVMVESVERRYIKRFELDRNWGFENITRIMRDKLGTLNSAERDNFYKEAPNIVSRLKEETQTFKEARYVIGEILRIEGEKEDLHEKDIYEIFELFVLGDFVIQLCAENAAFLELKSHEELWITNFDNWRMCEKSVNRLKEIKREKYTTNFYFRRFISQLNGKGWIHIERPDMFVLRPRHRPYNQFVSEDKLRKEIPGQWVDNPRAGIWSYEIENEDNKHEMLHFSHYEQIPLEQIIEGCKNQQKRMGSIIKLNLKYLVPMEDLEKNNVPFNIESLLKKSSEAKRRILLARPYWPDYEPYSFAHHMSHKNNVPFDIFVEASAPIRSSEPYSFPHYLFQLRNPPRPICQRNHLGKCQMDGIRKVRGWPDLPKELHIPVCSQITQDEVSVLKSYMNRIGSNRGFTFDFMKQPVLFLCCQNLLDIPFLILLDHPNNYENGESIPGLDFNKKLHHIEIGVLREYLQESKLNERVYALIKGEPCISYIRLIDNQGNLRTKWLDFKKVAEFGFPFAEQQQKLDLVF